MTFGFDAIRQRLAGAFRRPAPSLDGAGPSPDSIAALASRGGAGAGAAIVVDFREKPSGLPEAIERLAGVAPSVERLEVGDALVGGTFLVERKTWADLAASVADGRWFAQLAQMKRQPFRCLVVIEGDWKSLAELGVSPEALRGALLSAALDWGIPLLPSSSVDGTAKWLAALLARSEREGARPAFREVSPDGRRRAPAPEASDAARTPANPPAPPRPQARRPDAETRRREGAIAAIAAVDGVGDARAAALLERFGSVARVAAAGETELCEVPGVGKELARRIRASLGDGGGPAEAEPAPPQALPPNPFE